MKLRSLSVRQVSEAWLEVCLLCGSLLLCRQFVLGPMLSSNSIEHAPTGQEQTARLYRLIERQHYPISQYDDVGLGEIDTPIYFLESPPASGTIRQLDDSDFLVTNRKKLNDEFKENGRGDCHSCPYRQSDVPFMNATIRVLGINKSKPVVILGYERKEYSTKQWVFAHTVFALDGIYFFLALVVAWNYVLRDLVAAFLGVAPMEDWAFVLPRRFSFLEIIDGPNAAWFYLSATLLILLFSVLALATRLVWSF